MQAILGLPPGTLTAGQPYTITAGGQTQPITSFTWEQISGPPGGSTIFTNETANSADIEVNIDGVYTYRYCYYTRS